MPQLSGNEPILGLNRRDRNQSREIPSNECLKKLI
jgi:hypothetical protein